MNSLQKRIQFVYHTDTGELEKVWQIVDTNRFFILEHLWNDLRNRWLSAETPMKYCFYCERTKTHLPLWYHVDLLNDHDIISIECVKQSTSIIETSFKKTSVDLESIKPISKKKQLNAFLTNRSFVITDPKRVPEEFYREWQTGIWNADTKNAYFVY